MKRIIGIPAALGILAFGAAAQNQVEVGAKAQLEKLVAAAKMGRVVKNAPYSGEEVSETNQVLADGTRIHNESRTKVFRDSQGRVRRETGDNVSISDPVSGTNYSYSKDGNAVRTHMMTRRVDVAPGGDFSHFQSLATGGGKVNVSVKDGMITLNNDGQITTFPIPADGQWTSDDGKIKVFVRQGTSPDGGTSSMAHFTAHDGVITITRDGQTTTIPANPEVIKGMGTGVGVGAGAGAGAAGGMVMMKHESPNSKTDDLGEQTIEGVKARGTRSTATLNAGVIGNDRPLVTTNERWYSDELQTEIMIRRSDPRSGDSSFRLININRGEPAASLFELPSNVKVIDKI